MQYFLYLVLPYYLLMHAGLAGIFHKAGQSWWKALVPLYNVYVWLELIGKPKWWMIYFVIPVLNFIMGIGIILDLVRSFGKHDFLSHVAAVIFPFFYFPFLGFNKSDKYQGKWADLADNQPKKSSTREWLDAILFAGVAALVIRTFLIEAFMIPTTSMEGSLLAGDFLFVSKFHYGVRMPQAPLSIPFVHNTMPFTKGTRSFLDWVELPYSRLPGFRDVTRNDIVVFNYPDDDVYADVEPLGTINITSMKQNYIKRCVAVAGDTLQIKDKVIYIDGKPSWRPEHLQFQYFATGFGEQFLAKKGFRTDPNNPNRNAIPLGPPMSWALYMTDKMRDELSAVSGTRIELHLDTRGPADITALNLSMLAQGQGKNVIYPKDPTNFPWTLDNFGPLWIPKKGATITLTSANISIYKKIIDVYEKHDFKQEGDKFIIDGKATTTYTFQMNYYFMMGDNRDGSLDSRYWGYVPEDHVIGRPWMVLFSVEGGPRFERTFNPVTKWEP